MSRNLTLLVVGLGVTFWIAEVIWQIEEACGRVGSLVPRQVGQFDPYLGWSLKPGAVAVSKRTGSAVEYRINSKGLRDQERTYQKPKGIYRIVLIGDSYTFGAGVPIETHFSTLLRGSFTALEVINLGVNGYGIDQAFLRLQKEGFKYAPDLVIAFVPFYYSSPRYMYARQFGMNKPRFVLVQGELMLTGVPVHPRTTMFGNSLVAKFFFDAVPQGIADARNKADAAFLREMAELGEALIIAMHNASGLHGAQFLLVTCMPGLHERMVRQGIRSLNVSATLSNPALKLPRGLLHLNEGGNSALARVVAEFLHHEGLIPARHLRSSATQAVLAESDPGH